MSERRRHCEEGYCFHVLNRGAQRRQLFFSDYDYDRFEDLMFETLDRLRLAIFTYERMPNHWHFVVRPHNKEELSNSELTIGVRANTVRPNSCSQVSGVA
jgi:putative transposase